MTFVDLHVCSHMCTHIIAERTSRGPIEMRGAFTLQNLVSEFVVWMKRDTQCVRIFGTIHLAGGKHYNEIVNLERREDGWYRRHVTGWEKCEEDHG